MARKRRPIGEREERHALKHTRSKAEQGSDEYMMAVDVLKEGGRIEATRRAGTDSKAGTQYDLRLVRVEHGVEKASLTLNAQATLRHLVERRLVKNAPSDPTTWDHLTFTWAGK